MKIIRPLMVIIMLGAFMASSAFFYFTKGHISIREVVESPLPVLGKINDFKLQGLDKAVTLADFNGRIWVADFIFTTCGGICPTMTKNLRKVHEALSPKDQDVRLVSISVNPDTDTPDVLKAYAQKYQADTERWWFLTGSIEEIKRVAVGSFKLGAIDEPVFHSSYFTLVDRQARIRGYYDGTETESIGKLLDDIARLKKED